MQTFFGRWAVSATTDEGLFTERFQIIGSANADGIYEPSTDGTPLGLIVEGDQWSLDFQARFSEGDFFSYDALRKTSVIPPQGLTATMAAERIVEPEGTGFVINHSLVIVCISLDPTLNPPIPVIPVDFSVPD